MAHQVVITFDIDENKVAEYAEREAGRQIARDVFYRSFGTKYDPVKVLKGYVQEVIADMLEPEKDRIIKAAVTEIVGNLHRTKAVKDMLTDAAKEEQNGEA